MGKTSDQTTAQIITKIAEKIKQLDNGELSVNDLNDLVESSRNLYEHFIVLRYKAFDKFGAPTKEAPITIETPVAEVPVAEVITETPDEAPADMPFDFTGITEKTEEEIQPGFDFEMPAAPEEVQEEAPEEVTPINAEVVQEPIVEQEFATDEPGSLNDVFKSEDENSLRKKLQNSPISDIKSHISMAKKFEYISSMFKGSAEDYNESIEFLNTCATGKDAQLKLNALATENKWDLEDKSIIKFIELVERRYL